VVDSFRGWVSRTGWAVRSKGSIYGVEVALDSNWKGWFCSA